MNILGNIKKVITSYSNPNESPNSTQNIPNTAGSEYSTTSENNSTISLLKDESKFLKEKFNQLLKENELLKQSIFTNSNQSNSQITKIFKEFKSAFFSYDSNSETNKSIRDFKNFLFQNMLLYNSLEEEDIDVLNAINITDSDWNNNKDIYIFKQNLLERNYNSLMENLLVSNDLNCFLKENDLVADRKSMRSADNASEIQEKLIKASNTNNENNFNYNNSNQINNIINSQTIENDKRTENTKSSLDNKTKNINNNNLFTTNPNDKNAAKQAKSNILEDLIKDDDLQAEVVAAIFSKSAQEKIKATNESVKNKTFSSSNSLSNNAQSQAKSDNNIKGNSNKNTLKFDELLEPDIEFTHIKETLAKEVLLGAGNNKNNSVKDFENIKNTCKSSTNTAEIISDILKDKKVNIESLISNTLGKANVDQNQSTSSVIKPGRIKSPLDEDEEEDTNEDYISVEKMNFGENKNYFNSNFIENIDKNNNKNLQSKASPVIENAMKDLEKIAEKQKEFEKNFLTPSKNFEDLESNNLNYIQKQDVKEIDTPFNTPMSSEHFTEPKFLSNMKLGNTSLFQESTSDSKPISNENVLSFCQPKKEEKSEKDNVFSSKFNIFYYNFNFKGLLFDTNEEIESPFAKQTAPFKDNNRNSFVTPSLNKSNNAINSKNSKNPSSTNVQKEAPKKKNIWDDEDIDDF